MKIIAGFAALVASFALAACGPNEPPKATPTAPPASPSAATTKVEAKKVEKHEAPDTHGMPGMSELFKGDDKAADKPGEKK